MRDPAKELRDMLFTLRGAALGLDASKVVAMDGTYEQRKIDAYDNGKNLAVDTALVTDNDPAAPYETAVLDPRYADEWIPVANAATPEEAQKNHDTWVRIMTETPPDELLDVCTAEHAVLKDEVEGREWRVKRRGAA